MSDVQGFVHPKFEAVRGAFAAAFARGDDLGASFAATIDGEPVIDLWGGWADAEQTRPWEKDTIVNVYSTTKTMTALTALWLADQGALKFEEKVAHYWPEFAAAGKQDVTVAQLMSHAAGLSGFHEPMQPADLYDWDLVTSRLAAQAPFWEPGTAPGYHAVTQGYLVGEVVRRITGKSLGTVFAEQLAGPLGADFHIGLDAAHDGRVADLVPPPQGASISDGPQSALAKNMATNPPINPIDTRTRAWRAAEIPAAGGHGNARSVAAVQTLMANGGVSGGKRLLSEAGVKKALELQIEGHDQVLNMPVRYGMGYGLAGPTRPMPNPNTIFWGGYGGSLVVCDMDARLCMSYVMNKMAGTTVGDMRAGMLMAGVWGSLMA
ncbi:serine hydrolase domain-containing protein [Sandarakinorhabdus limnophila]|uniref:serine hydrolase domain-containing protein n=1 Tax=Sandarakinorhabdus limnophila TaxID=210512 RepID=UPI0026EA35B7|nr:serine hydrolase domain-containing protein [Sandarakinorhabdus limnophila]MCM0031893.1 beta-lactamase family protein [Sandarakinorhabdus limnophila]